MPEQKESPPSFPAFRVSVRALVAFSFFPPDITLGAGLAEMQAGTRAHQARETAQAEEFEIEKPLRCNVERGGETITLFGRMDAYREGNPPCVEEIKLCREPPDAPLPDHLAQTRLYAAMLTLADEAETVDTRVVYVNEDGQPLRIFAETAERAFLQQALYHLLDPWLAFAIAERAHRQKRDESLRAMAFPFPAYRAGQRELAVQVYTAITRRKRLFASLPTGTGKSAAVLFPALKALGEGKTRKLVYLTARTTARQSPLAALERMRAQGMKARVATLLAKEKLCPSPTRCHPDDCPRAKGHYLRQPDAIQKLLATDVIWSEEIVTAAADEYRLCPFELALALTELADVVLMDVNYAFDPFVQIVRLFQQHRDFTLLIDEAHHLLPRVQESLSGALDSRELRAYRTVFGKALGRKHPFYKSFSTLLTALRASGGNPETDGTPEASIPGDETTDSPAQTAPGPARAAGYEAIRLPAPPPEVTEAVQALIVATMNLLGERLPSAECRQSAGKLLRTLCAFGYAAEHFDNRYAALLTPHGKEQELELFCLSPAEVIAATTKNLRGSVFFSATLAPLPDMRVLLGGTEEDACFSLPSPFPPERLQVVRRRVQTRYAFREASAEHVAQSIAEAVSSRSGNYIVYFPSYAYLRLVLEPLMQLPVPPLLVQENDMSEEARSRFLAAFTAEVGPKLGLCVLGGVFSEGVDLPGEQLIGALIVGMGLPTPTPRLRAQQAYYEERFGDGFLYAWMIPAMQKVSQAAGRVIRTENDRGLVVLLDDRYYDTRYLRLLPPEWRIINEDIAGAACSLNRLANESEAP
ncbi:MAG: ATP-dependent DNA helicase [Eubacteriales bacterium]|nr:ATP-dependent DNA helicase [Eubacteriales bacterium]